MGKTKNTPEQEQRHNVIADCPESGTWEDKRTGKKITVRGLVNGSSVIYEDADKRLHIIQTASLFRTYSRETVRPPATRRRPSVTDLEESILVHSTCPMTTKQLMLACRSSGLTFNDARFRNALRRMVTAGVLLSEVYDSGLRGKKPTLYTLPGRGGPGPAVEPEACGPNPRRQHLPPQVDLPLDRGAPVSTGGDAPQGAVVEGTPHPQPVPCAQPPQVATTVAAPGPLPVVGWETCTGGHGEAAVCDRVARYAIRTLILALGADGDPLLSGLWEQLCERGG